MWNDVRTMNAITRLLLVVFVLVLAHAGYRWVARQPMFDLQRIHVQGIDGKPLRYVDVATVRSGALPRIHGNFFTVDLTATRAAFETVPWVKRASVRREWPNRLVVLVDEYVALGTWGGQEGRLVSVDGLLFTANLAEAEADGALPVLEGPDESAHEVAQRFADLRDWLAPLRLAPRELSLSNRYAWTVRLDNGIELNLGRISARNDMKTRIDRLASVYPQLSLALPGRIEAIDLRYPNGLALRRRAQPLSPPAGVGSAT